MRTAWRPSRGWTRSSPRWIRTTTTRSLWRSSKRRPRATHPSYYCCSVTSRNRPEGEQSAPPAATDCTERIFMFHSVCSYFHWKQTKKITIIIMLGLPFNESASCVWNTRVHENVICYKKIYTQHETVQVHSHTAHTHTHKTLIIQTPPRIIYIQYKYEYIFNLFRSTAKMWSVQSIFHTLYSDEACASVMCYVEFAALFIVPSFLALAVCVP